MRFILKILAGLWLAVAALGGGLWVRATPGPESGELPALAARAAKKGGWPELRRYAESARDPEQRGLAYFVLGYREYEAGEYVAAAEDLRQAAETKCLLADFAEYYRAAAAEKGNEPGQVVGALEGFAARYPESTLRLEAVELLGRALLATAQPEPAILALTAEPRVRQRPSLALLLAQGYGQAQKLAEAARAFHEVYHAFPTEPEAGVAAQALDQLRAQLGENFPGVSDEIAMARAETLFNKARFDQALGEYDALLRSRPDSPTAGRWKVGRARCLIRLKRVGEAVEALETLASANPETDAARLDTLVDAYVRQDDREAMLRNLDRLRELYPRSLFYASALSSVGNFFVRRGDWETAVRYFQPLAESFPEGDLGLEASWRVAWAHLLTRDNAKAADALLSHIRNYPTSPHLPAVLYWLGRLAEERGTISEARALYEALRKRFVHSYYALQAGRRLRAFPSEAALGTTGEGPLPPAWMAGLAQEIPPQPQPSIQPCAPATSGEDLRPFVTLKDLGLVNVAEQYLTEGLAARPTAPHLLLALSRFRAEQGNFSAALFEARNLAPDYSEYQFSQLPREVWDLLYPRAFWKLVERQARANRLDPYLVMGLIRQESAFNPRATSRADARGLMQILPSTASPSRRGRRAVARKLYDPAYNVRLGCRYLRGRLKSFGGSLEQALAAYNAGDFRVRDWLTLRSFREPAEFVQTVPIRETRVYVQAVLRDREIYRQLMTGSAEFAACEPAAKPEDRARKVAAESKPRAGPSRAGDSRRRRGSGQD